ncbi:MAG: MATE family efflux transporter [Deltaproteobacteria bacterium]|nr:MATE family efflux transporter [Deltaproteobacteria bacterium]
MSAPLPSRVTTATIVRLALPAAASALLNNAFRVIDQLAAGGISTPAQAAIGSCTFVLIACYAAHLVVAGGVGPLLARAVGANDRDLTARTVGTGLAACLLSYLAVALVVGLGAAPIAASIGLRGETAQHAATFIRTIAVFGLPLAVAPTIDAILVSRGQTGRMMALQVSAAVLNWALNPVLIHDLGLGVAGAAWATVLSRVPATVLGLWFAVRPDGARVATDDTLRRITRVGFPVATNVLAYALVYFLMLRTTISPLGPTVNAALGIGFSALEGITYPLFLGLSLAVTSVVGRELGAGRPEEARRAARLALPLTTALGVASGCVFWFLAPVICAPFTQDAAVLAEAVKYARALGWSQPSVAWEALAEGVLLGAGASRTVFWLSAPINALRIPLGYLLAFNLGWAADGAWWAINLTSFLKSGLKGVAAARGGWVGTRV